MYVCIIILFIYSYIIETLFLLFFTWISRPSFITDSRAPCSVFEFIPISGLNAFRPRMLFPVLLLPFPVFPTSIRRHCPSGKGFSSRSVRETKHIIHARTHARARTHTHTYTHTHTHTLTHIHMHARTHTHTPVSYTHLTLPTRR